MKNKKYMKYMLFCIFGILSILLINLTNASIELGTFKKNDCIQLQQTCDNCTYVNLTSITYPNSTLSYINSLMTKSGVKYNYSFCNTTLLGHYLYSVQGDRNGIISVEEGNFDITYTGDSLNTQKSILYVALLFVLLFFFILIIYFSGKLPSSEVRSDSGELLDINGLKYIGSVLIFADWMILIAIFYVTSSLAFAYLGEVLLAQIFFMFYKVCFRLTLPIIVVWFIWIFYQIFKDKKLRRMLEHGIAPNKEWTM